jgi:hypothetical protein
MMSLSRCLESASSAPSAALVLFLRHLRPWRVIPRHLVAVFCHQGLPNATYSVLSTAICGWTLQFRGDTSLEPNRVAVVGGRFTLVVEGVEPAEIAADGASPGDFEAAAVQVASREETRGRIVGDR